MVLHGYVGERQVAANVAVVGDSLHVFTVVSVRVCVCGEGRGRGEICARAKSMVCVCRKSVCRKKGKKKGMLIVNRSVTHALLFFPSSLPPFLPSSPPPLLPSSLPPLLPSSLCYTIPKNGGYSVELPKPAYLKIREEQEAGGTRSPKYPSTVTKVM